MIPTFLFSEILFVDWKSQPGKVWLATSICADVNWLHVNGDSRSGSQSNLSGKCVGGRLRCGCYNWKSQAASFCCARTACSLSRGVAQPGRAPGSGPGGRRFKSSLPDHCFQALKTHFWFSGYSAVVDFVDGESHRVQYAGDPRGDERQPCRTRIVLCVALRAEKAADYVIQSMRREVLSHSLAPTIAVWTSGEEPSHPQKDKATPNQALLFP